eukprot:2364301-Amphidinium_carterae.1
MLHHMVGSTNSPVIIYRRLVVYSTSELGMAQVGQECSSLPATGGPAWSAVTRRRTFDTNTKKILEDRDTADISPEELHGLLPGCQQHHRKDIRTWLTYAAYPQKSQAFG